MHEGATTANQIIFLSLLRKRGLRSPQKAPKGFIMDPKLGVRLLFDIGAGNGQILDVMFGTISVTGGMPDFETAQAILRVRVPVPCQTGID